MTGSRAARARQRGISIADDGHRPAGRPTLIYEGADEQGRRTRRRVDGEPKSPARPAFHLHFPGDRLEMTHLIARHGAAMGTVQRDNDLF